MNKAIQIGGGNKTFDRLYLYFLGGIFLVLVIASFLNIDCLIPAGIMLLIIGFHRDRIMRRYYIYIDGGHFIVRHIFERDVRIEKDQYSGISRSWSSIPFTTERYINFKNGKKFLFIAGDNRIGEVDQAIKRIMLLD